jgi:hypothetical protein
MNMDDTVAKFAEADRIVAECRPLLAGHDPDTAGAALGQLVAVYVAGHAPGLRVEALALVYALARDLVPIMVEEMIEAGKVGAGWRDGAMNGNG